MSIVTVRFFVVLVTASLLLAKTSAITSALEQRLALVVTNQAYSRKAVPPLRFPSSDGEIVAAALKKVGFTVRYVRDGTQHEFLNALQMFGNDLKDAGPEAVAFFYFSGHAWDVANENYILFDDIAPPPDGNGQQPDDKDAYAKRIVAAIGVPIKRITKALREANSRATFVVIDSHLNVAEPALSSNGMILAAQGRPGMIAYDTNNFSKALAGALQTPGINASGVFKQLQVKVAEVTNGTNVPLIDDRLLSSFSFAGAWSDDQARQITVTQPVAKADEERLDLAFWDAVKDATDPRLLQAYLSKFPEGAFRPIAEIKIEEINKQEKASASRVPDGQTAALVDESMGPRVALVVGNSKYTAAGFLPNPVNDASAIATSLRKLGFVVVQEHSNLSKPAMLSALKSFSDAATTAEWVVVYYAGHGMEVNGVNYLIPTDAKLDTEQDIEDEAVPVSRIFERISEAKAVKIIILDACRDNPFKSRMIRRGGSRSGGSRGLAEIKAGSGVLVAYAASPGEVALDGVGDNSPYATGLIKHLDEPGLDIRIMFSKVHDTVLEGSGNKQEPWYSAALPGKPLFFSSAPLRP